MYIGWLPEYFRSWQHTHARVAFVGTLIRKLLMFWPRAVTWLWASLALALFALVTTIVFIRLDFPSAPPGDSWYYLFVAFGQAIDFMLLDAGATLPAGWQGGLIRILELGLIFTLAVGPAIAVNRARIVYAATRRGPHYLIIGDGGMAEQVARARSGPKAASIQLSPKGQLEVRKYGVIAPLSDYPLAAQPVHTSVVDQDDLLNYRIARADNYHAIRFVQLSHPALRRRLSSELRVRKRRPVLFGQAELLARMSLRLHPPNWIVQDSPLQIVILGWGIGAMTLLIALLRSCHFASVSRPEIRLLCRSPDLAEAEFLSEQAALLDYYPASFEACDTTEPGRLLNALERSELPSMIYLSHGDGAELLSCADALAECQATDCRLAVPVQVMTPEQPPELFEELRDKTSNLPWFRINSLDLTTVGDELEIQSRLDRLAVRIHENYYAERLSSGERPGDRPSVVHWGDLHESYREENRAQADHHWIKLRELGIEAIERHSCSGEGINLDGLSDESLERLAIAEHDRWVCSRLSSGWRYSSERDDTRLRHPDLVPWENLSEEVKEYDRQAIRSLGDVFNSAGLVLRAYRVEFGASDTDPAPRLVAEDLPDGLAPRLVCIDVGDQPAGDTDPFDSFLLIRAQPDQTRDLMESRLTSTWLAAFESSHA